MGDRTLDQAQGERSNGSVAASPPRAVARNARSLTHHIAGLVELQSQLLLVDAGECARKSLIPLGVLLAGAIVALSGLPLLLLSLAYGMIQAGMQEWLAMLLSAVAGFVVGGILVLVGWKTLRPRLAIMQRSLDELKKNIDWIKTAVKNRPEVSGSA